MGALNLNVEVVRSAVVHLIFKVIITYWYIFLYQMNGGTYTGNVRQSFGGVGRNVADALSRLGVDTKFISAVGQDSHAAWFETHCSHMVCVFVVLRSLFLDLLNIYHS